MTSAGQGQQTAETSSRLPAPTGQLWQKIAAFLWMMFLIYLIPALAGLLRLTPRFFSPERLKESAWIGLYEGHFWQMVLTLAAIGFLSRGKFSEWGLNLRNSGVTWRIFWKFCLVYSVIIFFVNALPHLRSHEAPSFGYPLTRSNIIGWLTFEWMFVGISEEILFRGLIHTFLAHYWRGMWQIGKLAFPTAGLGATLLFCQAHVDIGHMHVHVSWPQQLFAFGLGIYYSAVYHRTQSLLGPILSHNFSDGIIFAVLYLTYWRLS